MKIIVRSRQDFNDKLELTLEEFKAKFSKELRSAINTFIHQEQKKDWLQPWKLSNLNKNYEHEFYQDLRWNFNHHARTLYYIDKFI